MSIALTEDLLALSEIARNFLSHQRASRLSRQVLEQPDTDITELWHRIAALGWLAIHLPAACGGEDHGFAELAVIAEALGKVRAPVPFIPTVVAAWAVAESPEASKHSDLLTDLGAGTHRVGLGLSGNLVIDGDGAVTGDAGPVLGAACATLLAVCVGDDVALLDAQARDVDLVCGTDVLDPTTHIRRAVLDSAAPVVVLPGAAQSVRIGAQVLGAAEAAGVARSALDAAKEYVLVRHQFGRAIGSFQAVKHHLANMLAETELAVAVAWDGARAIDDGRQCGLAADVATAISHDAAVRTAEKCLQIHGGIGFTWEHDCHLHLRRAQTMRALTNAESAPRQVFFAAAQGVHRHPVIDFSQDESSSHREKARKFATAYRSASAPEQRLMLVDSGYLMPHWPHPFGRQASTIEQLVIEEEFAGLDLPDLGIGAWVTFSLVRHCTPAQRQRWIRPSLLGEVVWCQLFSEPGAGSDAAAVATRGTRIDGGWLINGQKVWTSNALSCTHGLATTRTDPSAPKRDGITTMIVDLSSPGVTIRPLREITGDALFNEIFFDDVFIPDDNVVGTVNDGWSVARAVLGNERVSIGGSAGRAELEDLVALVQTTGADPVHTHEAGRLLALAQALRLLNQRRIEREICGGDPGPEGSLTKLMSAEHRQRVAELSLRVAGNRPVLDDRSGLARHYLFSRAFTIAGGTSEVNRNVIAERILGMPRDPL